MSDNRLTIGWVAQLATPIDPSDYSEVNERLYSKGSALGVGYSGELVFMSGFDKPLYDAMDVHVASRDDSAFKKALQDEGIEIIGKPELFFEVWYDGADSGISELTLAQLKEKAK